ERRLVELHDPLPRIEAMPWLRARPTDDVAAQRAMVVSRIRHELHRHARLPQSAIHLLRLAKRIRRISLALQQHERRLRVTHAGERTLPPRILEPLPRLSEIPAVVP